jgi:hypothetical protein
MGQFRAVSDSISSRPDYNSLGFFAEGLACHLLPMPDETLKDTNRDATENDLFARLRREVELEISGYVYEVPPGAVGTPFSPKEIQDHLSLMRLCLVDPHWEEVEVRDTFEQIQTDVGPSRKCITIAEDESGYVLMFDPLENSYVLAYRNKERGLGTFGIRGDAVGCFLAR